jgi:hypothetical protein
MPNWFVWLKWLVVAITAAGFLHSVYRWKTARPRTKSHVFSVLLTGGLILLQVPDLLNWSNTVQVIFLVLTFALFVYAMWYGAGIRKSAQTQDKAP